MSLLPVTATNADKIYQTNLDRDVQGLQTSFLTLLGIPPEVKNRQQKETHNYLE